LLCAQSFCWDVFPGLNWAVSQELKKGDAENIIEISLKALDYAYDIASLTQGFESHLLSKNVNRFIDDQWIKERILSLLIGRKVPESLYATAINQATPKV